MKYPMRWNLDRIFEGGSDSETFQKELKTLKNSLDGFQQSVENDLNTSIKKMQDIGKTLHEMESFTHCLLSQNVEDTQAPVLLGQMQEVRTRFANILLQFDQKLLALSEEAFSALIKEHASVAFPLQERRTRAKEKLSLEDETFINQLSIDGYHGWSEMWDSLLGEMTFPFEGKEYSFGQIENKLSDPSRDIRKKAFDTIEETFAQKKNSCAQILNHLAGFRLQTYGKRGWENVLKEPLECNRQSEGSLNAMWAAIRRNQGKMVEFLKRKADLLDLDSLSWFDLEAPLSSSAKEISYDEAASLVLSQFKHFSPRMADFAKKAFENEWIEAEDRKGKRPGGFCIALPKACESRIFMTYSNTITNLYTLAHELGHAFHNEIIFPLDELNHHPSMGLAETASTMAEMIVTQAMIEKEEDPKERLILLDDHLSRAASYFLNIYARFLFETRFYEARKKGVLPPETLCALMEEAQREAYGGALDRVHPLFWSAKIHFYCTGLPFYNFPYTFGYLFSLAIYSFAKKEKNFEPSYIALLEDTGRMTPESLAKKHLKTDITQREFWQNGIDIIHQDIEAFIQLSKEVAL